MLQIQTEMTISTAENRTFNPEIVFHSEMKQVARKYRDKIYHGKRLLKDNGKNGFFAVKITVKMVKK